MAYPTALDTLLTAANGATTQLNDATYDHATNHNTTNAAVNALERLLGTNASQTTPTATNAVLNSTSASAATWSTTPTISGLTVAASGLQVTTGNVGIGGAQNAAVGLWVQTGDTLTGTSQYGVLSNAKFSSSATVQAYGVDASPSTAAASFTTPIVAGFHAGTITAGSGSAITSAYGVLIDAQTGGGTNNYGIFVNAPSGGSGKNVSLALGTNIGNGSPAISATAVNGSDIIALVRATDSTPIGNFIGAYNAALSATVFAVGIDGGVTVGANPTGGDKGAGTINVATNIYLNGTAYTNPDYVLEQFATGRIVRHADKAGARGYRHLSLAEMEMHARTWMALPGFGQDAGLGLFDGGDHLLANLEEAFIYLFEHERRLVELEARLTA